MAGPSQARLTKRSIWSRVSFSHLIPSHTIDRTNPATEPTRKGMTKKSKKKEEYEEKEGGKIFEEIRRGRKKREWRGSGREEEG